MDKPVGEARMIQFPTSGRAMDAAAVVSLRLTDENSTRSRDSNSTDVLSLSPIASSCSSPESVVPAIECSVKGRVPKEDALRLVIAIPPALSACPISYVTRDPSLSPARSCKEEVSPELADLSSNDEAK
jgi:hypothetical protein